MTVIKVFKHSAQTTADEILKEISQEMAFDLVPDEIFKGLKEREELASTNLGNHLAFPHCKLKDVKQFQVGVFVMEEPLEFGPSHKGPVKLLVVVVAPVAQPDAYIKLMGKISKALSDDATMKSCCASDSVAAVAELLGV